MPVKIPSKAPQQCPKCKEYRAKAHLIHQGYEVGKCENPHCGYWGKLRKVENEHPAPNTPAKGKTDPTEKAAASGAAPAAANRRAAPIGTGNREAKSDPIPYTPPDTKRWWDFLDLF